MHENILLHDANGNCVFSLMRNLHSHFTEQLFELKDPILNNSHGMEFTGVASRRLSQEEGLLRGKGFKTEYYEKPVACAINLVIV